MMMRMKKMITEVSDKYKNLNRAIESLQCDEDIEKNLHQARESRNELIHEATLGALKGLIT
jgi:vacuolar-type H+-ATPase subunit H